MNEHMKPVTRRAFGRGIGALAAAQALGIYIYASRNPSARAATPAPAPSTTRTTPGSSDKPICISRQGVFQAGGTVQTAPGTFDPVHGQMAEAGQTRHSDHAHVFYQLPQDANNHSVVFLHGYGQSSAGWQSTPDGREGWSDFFLRRGYGVYLVDQPRRGKAGQSSVPVQISATPDDLNWFTQFRYPTAERLSALGYHCFVVDYRVRPYTQAEAGCDPARAIRFVRAHAGDYRLPGQHTIALGGYSAGGILCGETILNWSGTTSPTALDAGYAPDELDTVSADAAATAMIYSFYGRLSVAELNPDRLAGIVPTYYCYGTRDPFHDQFEAQVKVMAGLGATLHARVLDGWPHGFGAEGGWIEEYDAFMQRAFSVS